MQELEMEFKNALTKEEYDQLIAHFDLTQFFWQENHYFDTLDKKVRQLGFALRVRVKNDTYELTLKQPVENGNLETNQHISKSDFETFLESGRLPLGIVFDQLVSYGLIDNLHNLTSIKTRRSETAYKDGLLVLDYSLIGDTDDYELEYEVKDYVSGEKNFLELLNTFQIKRIPTDPKIKRAFDAIK